jgi:hypothetical protein
MRCIPQTHTSQDKRSFEGLADATDNAMGDCRAFSVNDGRLREANPVCDKFNSWS